MEGTEVDAGPARVGSGAREEHVEVMSVWVGPCESCFSST